ncbi:MAG: RNA-guided pseudouridylation complex pseudouridine synthase subunit Cbf5 [Candidatus Bathyarchaeota archaeon]|nr:RNA-guided pseudouridylation complex pseudouridine synthase subunit Cbf5 [Candidatus Bathyarchaeota archaeon]
MKPSSQLRKREIIQKNDEETDYTFGSIPKLREINEYMKYGIINLDKPSGPTSHEVVAWLKRILKINRAGHGGTLDPKVTGVLPVTLNEATKISQVFLYSRKEYVCVMRLHGLVPEDRVNKMFREFTGRIYQRPPLRSSVSRRLRTRTIYYIKDIEFGENRVLFRVGCQAGTYIRKLCFDIGEALGVGAHMEELRRTKTGSLTEDHNLVTLYDLYNAYHTWTTTGSEELLRAYIQPMETALQHIAKIYIRDSAVASICHGARLAIPGIAKLESRIRQGELIALVTQKGELVALAHATMSAEEIRTNQKGIAAITTRVLMPLTTYPRLWKKQEEQT